jgi:ParB-like chromosome segregation protein Spo0J
VSAKGRQWVERELRITEVRERNEFQLRAGSLDRAHVTRLRRVLEAGKPLPPVKVAHVGQVLYLVDGFHRLEAHRLAGRETVGATVARMSLPEARKEAQLANTTHGKNLSRADKNRLWADFTDAEGHREACGRLKSPRTIAAELNHAISRETIRKNLKAMGLEHELEPVKPWGGEPADEETLAAERMLEAETNLRLFGELVPTLSDGDQRELLQAARDLLDALERGEIPAMLQVAGGGLLDI